MKLNGIYIILLILALIGIVIYLTPKVHHYDWDQSHYPTAKGNQPFDTKLFDQLLERSLPNGITKRHIKTLDYDKDHIDTEEFSGLKIREIIETPADTSIIIIDTYNWRAVDEYYTPKVNQLPSLLRHAGRGGKSLLVLASLKPYSSLVYSWNTDASNIGIIDHCISQDTDLDYYGYDLSKPDWIKIQPSKPLTLVSEGRDTVRVDSRFTMFCFYEMSPDDPDLDMEVSFTERPLLVNTDDHSRCYALDLYFPESGGHIYITTLNMYFCNLGVTIPGGEKVISHLVSKIDDRPIVKYDHEFKNIRKKDSDNGNVFYELHDNDALWTAWLLSLSLIGLVLTRGLVRRYPKDNAYVLDKTDAVAVREYKFRKSPLLHFIYQCSWLYQGSQSYDELFLINCRRLARVVNKVAGIEFKSADDRQLRDAASIFAAMQGRTVDEVYDELKWMHDSYIREPISVTPKQYRYSQQVVERYPIF